MLDKKQFLIKIDRHFSPYKLVEADDIFEVITNYYTIEARSRRDLSIRYPGLDWPVRKIVYIKQLF